MTILAIIVLSVLFLSLVFAASFNGFVHRKNALEYAYQSLETIVQKRHDLLPKLAEVVQTSAQFEYRLVEETNKLLQMESVKGLPAAQMMQKENQLVLSLSEITQELRKNAAVRQSKSFMHLQKSIVEVEEQISASRRAYNAAVMEYNNSLEMFPTVLFATILKSKKAEPLELKVVNTQIVPSQNDQNNG